METDLIGCEVYYGQSSAKAVVRAVEYGEAWSILLQKDNGRLVVAEPSEVRIYDSAKEAEENLEANILNHLKDPCRGKIEAIKHVRAVRDLALKDAKSVVEEIAERNKAKLAKEFLGLPVVGAGAHE